MTLLPAQLTLVKMHTQQLREFILTQSIQRESCQNFKNFGEFAFSQKSWGDGSQGGVMCLEVFPMSKVFAFVKAKTVIMWYHAVMQNALTESSTLKTWYCSHCCRLPQFKPSKKSTKGKPASAVTQAAMLCSTICICKTQATETDRLLECHSTGCGNGHFIHLGCLGLKRMPNNSKTTWQCEA